MNLFQSTIDGIDHKAKKKSATLNHQHVTRTERVGLKENSWFKSSHVKKKSLC